MNIQRELDLLNITKKKSVFLLGPRQTGKSSLIKDTIPPEVPVYNLLDRSLFASLSANPCLIREQLTQKHYKGLVVIDEIQRIPELLDEVHLMIEELGLRFLLTGSSARKLRQAGTNLLGGRARRYTMHPLTYRELGAKFNLLEAVNYGLLPSIVTSDEPQRDLYDYVGLYLQEEIEHEASVRNLPSFSRFLSIAALTSGQQINYSNVASDAKEKRHTVTNYFQILNDTLIGSELPGWDRTRKRKPIEMAKYYLFDIGICRAINRLPPIKEKSPEFGSAIEHIVLQEIKAYISYKSPLAELHYWRSSSNFEVDFIFDNRCAIEVKAKDHISVKDLRGLQALQEENLLESYIVVSLEEQARLVDGIHILPIREFFTKLWDDEI